MVLTWAQMMGTFLLRTHCGWFVSTAEANITYNDVIQLVYTCVMVRAVKLLKHKVYLQHVPPYFISE